MGKRRRATSIFCLGTTERFTGNISVRIVKFLITACMDLEFIGAKLCFAHLIVALEKQE